LDALPGDGRLIKAAIGAPAQRHGRRDGPRRGGVWLQATRGGAPEDLAELGFDVGRHCAPRPMAGTGSRDAAVDENGTMVKIL
jgi:hypothetical protein